MQEENFIFNIKLTFKEANLVLEALQELPAKVCNPLTVSIRTQAEEQLKEHLKEVKTEE